MNDFLQNLNQPEYVHVLLNPIPTHLLPIGVLAMIAAFFMKGRGAMWIALGLVFVSAISVWPVVEYGESGFDRVLSMSDDAGADWLKIHQHRATEWAWMFYVLAAVSLMAIVLPRKWPRLNLPLCAVTLLLAIVDCGIGIYIADPAGKIRHEEFRNGPPPAEAVK